MARSCPKVVHTIAACQAGRKIPGGVRGGNHDVEVRLVLVENELIDERCPGDKFGGLEIHRHPVHVLQWKRVY